MADQRTGVPVTAEIAPLFGTETSVPVGQATSPPVTQEPESGTQAGGEGSPTGVTQQATTTVEVATAAPLLPAEQTSTTTTAKALPEDLYDLQRCTVCVLLQFYPVGEAGRSRQVLLSIQNGTGNKEDLPLLAVLDEDKLGGPLPPALQALWSKLEADLPLRKQRHEERAAQSAQQAAASNAARLTPKKVITPAKPANPLLPPPTASTPIQKKEELTMGGLFDGA
jgi:hypothetical protein